MSWTNITNILTNILNDANVKNVDSVMTKWNSSKSEISKNLKASTKKESNKKDSTKPKKANTAYIFFTTDYLNNNPGKKMPDVADVWNNMSVSDKKKYNELAVQDKERYTKEMERWNLEHPTETQPKKKEARPKAEKKTPEPSSDKKKSPWNAFTALQRPLLKAEFPDAKSNEISKKLSEMWASFSDEKKKSFGSESATAVAPTVSSAVVETKSKLVIPKTEGFKRFCSDVKNSRDLKDLTEKKREAELANRWHALSNKTRQEYEKMDEESEDETFSDESELEDEEDD